MRHKHYDCIVAWAKGKTIQRNFSPVDGWEDWTSKKSPSWHENAEYRIKPEPKPDLIKYIVTEAISEGVCRWDSATYAYANLRLTFDGETGRLKSAEVL